MFVMQSCTSLALGYTYAKPPFRYACPSALCAFSYTHTCARARARAHVRPVHSHARARTHARALAHAHRGTLQCRRGTRTARTEADDKRQLARADGPLAAADACVCARRTLAYLCCMPIRLPHSSPDLC